jgi:5-methylthioadenosine/S-adenosylhomocysteine deaminase
MRVLRADTVVTVDEDDRVWSPGAVAIDGDTLVAVGPPDAMPDGAVLDLGRSALLPGLVNTHTHSPMWLFRGLTEDVPRGEWLDRRLRPIERRVSVDELVAGARVGCLEMLLNGTTTIADRYAAMDRVAAAVEASGVRAIVAHSLYDADAERGLRTTELLLDRFGTYPDRSRVTAGIGPHATDTCGEDVLRRVRALAERRGARVFIHLAQSEAEVATVRARVGLGCAAALDRVGLLAPDVVVAHGTYLSQDEAALVGRRGTGVAHCPSSNAKLEARVAPVPRLLASGAVVGLGTDAAACNNGMDLFEEMKIAGLVHKLATGDPSALPAARLVRMATLDGARALGLAHLVGSLEVGKRADLTAVRLDTPATTPCHDVFAQLVYATRGRDVQAVWVDGEQLVRDGRPTRLDQEAIMEAALAAARRARG